VVASSSSKRAAVGSLFLGGAIMSEILLNDVVQITKAINSGTIEDLGKIGKVTSSAHQRCFVLPPGRFFYAGELTRFYSYAFLSSRSSNELKGAKPR
jgi:hypothetical protein